MNMIKMILERKNRNDLYWKAEYWNEKALIYKDESISMWPNNNLNFLYDKEQKEIIEAYYNNLEGEKIIDVGCGIGRISRHFSRKGATVKGIDFSKNSIEVAKKMGEEKIEYELISIYDFDEKEKYNKAFNWAVLAVACRNKEELERALIKIYNSLKKNGNFLMIEPIHKGFLHRVLNISMREFTETMEKVGFEVIDIKQMHFWPARLILSYFTIPMFITKPIYKLGQFLMKIIPNSGDYKLIYAKKK